MNYLWGGMILIGIVYGMCTGNISEVTQAVIQSSKEAVNLCIGGDHRFLEWADEDCGGVRDGGGDDH